MLIDYTYFIGEILIAGRATTPIQNSITQIIGKREPEYLEAALGYGFNKLFTAGIAETSGRWFDLRKGAEYVNEDGFTKKWKGFQNTELQSPIANYVYYWSRRNDLSFTATVGEMEGKTEKAKPVDPGPKMMRAWNEMVDQTRLLHDYLLNKKDGAGTLIYDEFDIDEVSCSQVLKKINNLGL